MLSYGTVPTGRKIAPYRQYRGSGKGLFLSRTQETITLNRRDFLRLSGIGLAGVALVGIAGCGGGGTIGGGGSGGGSKFGFGRGGGSGGFGPLNVTHRGA